jgi:hypothetical protein
MTATTGNQFPAHERKPRIAQDETKPAQQMANQIRNQIRNSCIALLPAFTVTWRR